MGLDATADLLTRNVRRFERCYFDDCIRTLADIDAYADHIAEGDFGVLDEDMCRQGIVDSLSILKNNFSRVPEALQDVEVCTAHLSVIGEFWGRYLMENLSFVRGEDYSKSGLRVSGITFSRTCQSLLRCITLDPDVAGILEVSLEVLPTIDDLRNCINMRREKFWGLAHNLEVLIKEVDEGIKMIYSTVPSDVQFAPAVVSAFMFHELEFWSEDFLEAYGGGKLSQIGEITLAMRQLESVFKRNYKAAVDTLRMIPGYEKFETIAGEINGAAEFNPYFGNLRDNGL